MRELKFRAWDKVNKTMVYKISLDDEGRAVRPGYQWWSIGNTLLHSPVMQYTGLKDCKDKEIYEGDALEWIYELTGHPFEGVVEYHKDSASFYIKGNSWQDNRGFNNVKKEHLEIIGNVHENPELLK